MGKRTDEGTNHHALTPCEKTKTARTPDLRAVPKRIAKAAHAHERLLRGEKPRGFSIRNLDYKLFDQLAHVIGYQLGERLYHGFREQLFSNEDIREFFYLDLSPENEATAFYLKLYFRLRSVELPERL